MDASLTSLGSWRSAGYMEDRQQLGVHAFAFDRVISFFITLRSPMSLVLVTRNISVRNCVPLCFGMVQRAMENGILFAGDQDHHRQFTRSELFNGDIWFRNQTADQGKGKGCGKRSVSSAAAGAPPKCMK